MSNFLEALSSGLEQARRMDQNKRDINNKLEELNSSLQSATDGKVAFSFTLDENNPWGAPQYNILAINPLNESVEPRLLGMWIEDPTNGFPCHLKTGRSAVICNSLEEIELAFSELVSSPPVASFFLTLMSN